MTEDITNRVFGRLTAVCRVSSSVWFFACECGGLKQINKYPVLKGRTRSCGCLHLERCKSGKNRLSHGDAKSGKVHRLHSIWRGMHKRCNPSNNSFAIERYAARGIRVCEEWSDYLTFKKWALDNGYDNSLSIERLDNNDNYCPENCKWATRSEQSRNRSTTRWIIIDGLRKPLAEWLDISGVGRSAFHNRIKRGWPLKEALGLEQRSSN